MGKAKKEKRVDLSSDARFETDVSQLLGQLKTESDRGNALIFVSFLEELLRCLFVAKMVNTNENSTGDLLDNKGPLATLSAKIEVAFALGWISKDMYRDLDTLRKIRNEFAHSHQTISFSTGKVADLAGNLRQRHSLPEDSSDTPFDKFYLAVTILMVQLKNLINQSKSPTTQDP